MLTEKQLEEIREHLEKAQNPIFLYDNDADGLCSFALLRRFLGRGEGVPIKSFPDLNDSYFAKVKEFNSDYVFILDKPVVSSEFFESLKTFNLPCVWIDHHNEPNVKIPENVYYYNSVKSGNKENIPVTYICYEVVKKKKEEWLALIGCLNDAFIPDFFESFRKKNKELFEGLKNSSDPFSIWYDTEFGKIIQMINFAIKDVPSKVKIMQDYFVDMKNPRDLLEENEETKTIHSRYDEIKSRFDILMEKALSLVKEDELFYFKYGGILSLSSDIANKLCYLYPDKTIVVAYVKGAFVNLSLRGKKDILSVTKKAIDGLSGASGGGHKNATGAKILASDLDLFLERVKKEIE